MPDTGNAVSPAPFAQNGHCLQTNDSLRFPNKSSSSGEHEAQDCARPEMDEFSNVKTAHDVRAVLNKIGRRPPGMLPLVYFVAVGEYVKIGKSAFGKFKSRFIGIQTGCPLDLRVVGIVSSWDTTLEKYLHRLFWMNRSRGEWFRIDQRLHAWVESNRTHVPDTKRKHFGYVRQRPDFVIPDDKLIARPASSDETCDAKAWARSGSLYEASYFADLVNAAGLMDSSQPRKEATHG